MGSSLSSVDRSPRLSVTGSATVTAMTIEPLNTRSGWIISNCGATGQANWQRSRSNAVDRQPSCHRMLRRRRTALRVAHGPLRPPPGILCDTDHLSRRRHSDGGVVEFLELRGVLRSYDGLELVERRLRSELPSGGSEKWTGGHGAEFDGRSSNNRHIAADGKLIGRSASPEGLPRR